MSTSSEFVKCECTHCGGPLEVPRDYLGSSHACPHCGKETVLSEGEPPKQPKPRTISVQTELPTDNPVVPVRIRRRRPPGPSYTLLAVFGFLVGLGMIVMSLAELDAETVFQQVAGRLLGIGGVVICGLAIVVEMVNPVLGYLWELSLRLESIEERLSRMSRKL